MRDMFLGTGGLRGGSDSVVRACVLSRAVLLGSVLMLASGCHGQAAAPVAPGVADAPVRSAFLIYTAGDSGLTSWLVPFTRSADRLEVDAAIRLDGVWLQDDDAEAEVIVWSAGEPGEPRLSEAAAQQLWQARCAPGAAGVAACTWPLEQVYTRLTDPGLGAPQRLDDRTCACFDLPVADLAVLRAGDYASVDVGLDEEEEAAEEVEDPELEACAEYGGPV
ncbi:hypothetical protein [Nannocystis punicea]|uniref:Lipoprotein n=1 Tax=Nannocystis punicea TaxID=2995304 RepID=A0ABY7H336_9BACT|nr:hypothetical protein [Nannocystis poenicansa]WAS93454.1 hypothetical protein O0S08_45550 [Nannocystis poenicansa]